MKRLLSIMLFALLFVGCAKMPVAMQSGKEDVGYLLFVAQSGSTNRVTVMVDNGTPFKANVVRAKKAGLKGTEYGFPAGAHTIKVVRDNEVLYQKKIFLSSQEIKQITLSE